MTQANEAQIAYWNDRAGRIWTTLQEQLDAQFAALTQAILAAAAPAAGEHVVDIGCGCGATVLALAEKVGPSGSVLGLDISHAMAGRAAERIAERGLRHARVEVSDASAHPFEPATADLLFSRFGVMFFENPAAAFAHMRGALRPGGRLLCAAWRPLAENAWFDVPIQAARDLLPPQPPPVPHAPGPFAFADAERVVGMLGAAGWREARATRQDAPLRFAGPGEVETAASFATQMGPLGRMLAEVDDDTRENVRRAVVEALRPYDTPDGVIANGSVWLYSARA